MFYQSREKVGGRLLANIGKALLVQPSLVMLLPPVLCWCALLLWQVLKAKALKMKK